MENPQPFESLHPLILAGMQVGVPYTILLTPPQGMGCPSEALCFQAVRHNGTDPLDPRFIPVQDGHEWQATVPDNPTPGMYGKFRREEGAEPVRVMHQGFTWELGFYPSDSVAPRPTRPDYTLPQVEVSLRTGEWLHHGIRFGHLNAKPSHFGFTTPITGAMLAHKLNTDHRFYWEVKKLYGGGDLDGANVKFSYRQRDGQVTALRVTRTDGTGSDYHTFPCTPIPVGEDTTIDRRDAKEVLAAHWAGGYAEGTHYLVRTLLEHICREQHDDTFVWCGGMRWEADHRFQTITIHAEFAGEGSVRHTVPVSLLNTWANVRQHMYCYSVWAPYSLPDSEVSGWTATISREQAESY